jgi:hypothetical protein
LIATGITPSCSCRACAIASWRVAGDVEVRGAAAAVADRERRVGDEEPERGQRDRHPGHDREHHVERILLGQVEAGEGGDEDAGEERHRQ